MNEETVQYHVTNLENLCKNLLLENKLLKADRDEVLEYMKTLNNEIDCLIDGTDYHDIRYEVFEKISSILERGKNENSIGKRN